jgi:hypothetical protein
VFGGEQVNESEDIAGVRSLFRVVGRSDHRPWQSPTECRGFARRFSKALVEELARGRGSVIVQIRGEIVWSTCR